MSVLVYLHHEETLLILESWWQDLSGKDAISAFMIASLSYELNQALVIRAAHSLLGRGLVDLHLCHAIMQHECEDCYEKLFEVLQQQEKQEYWVRRAYSQLCAFEPLQQRILHLLWEQRQTGASEHIDCVVMRAWLDEPGLEEQARSWIYRHARRPVWSFDLQLQVEALRAILEEEGGVTLVQDWIARALLQRESGKARLIELAIEIDADWAWSLLTVEVIDAWSTWDFMNVMDRFKALVPPDSWLRHKIDVESLDTTLSWLAVGAPGATDEEILSLRSFPELRVQHMAEVVSLQRLQHEERERLLASIRDEPRESARWWYLLSILIPVSPQRWWLEQYKELGEHLRIPGHASDWYRSLRKKSVETSKRRTKSWDENFRRKLVHP